MNELQELQRSAYQSATWRGHRLETFVATGPHSAAAHCLYCHAGAFVNAKPLPNQIDISGEAVAINCDRSEG